MSGARGASPAARSTRHSWRSRARIACPSWGSTGATIARSHCAGSSSSAIPTCRSRTIPRAVPQSTGASTGAPETFLIDANGLVVKKHVGPMTMDVWQREFLPLLPPAAEGPLMRSVRARRLPAPPDVRQRARSTPASALRIPPSRRATSGSSATCAASSAAAKASPTPTRRSPPTSGAKSSRSSAKARATPRSTRS